MGNAKSSAAYDEIDEHTDDDDDNLDPFDGIDTIGYRVLGVQPNSPASKAGLVSFLDFLVGAQGQMLLGSGEGLKPGEEYNDVDLPALLNEYKEKPIEFCKSYSNEVRNVLFVLAFLFLLSFPLIHFTHSLTYSHTQTHVQTVVYNMKSQQARLVQLTPSDTWGGAGLLGVTIRLDNYAGAEDRLVRVLSVQPQSPAAIAGLVPLKDFLLGTTHQTLNSSAELAILLREHQDQVVELYVYNTDSDMVRVVALMPTLDWGGEGLLGAEVGTGYLHRLPSSARATEGTSVERKVRYVGVKKPTGSMEDTAARNDTATSPNRTLLEVEPQLEMEVEQDDDDDDDDDDENAEEVEIPKQPPVQVATAPTKTPTTEAEALFQRPPAHGIPLPPPPPQMHST